MGTNAKLFRAIVVLGASLTAGCKDEPCGACPPDVVATVDAAPTDAPPDAPGDAMVDAILIL